LTWQAMLCDAPCIQLTQNAIRYSHLLPENT
jgi:hypothetical protein